MHRCFCFIFMPKAGLESNSSLWFLAVLVQLHNHYHHKTIPIHKKKKEKKKKKEVKLHFFTGVFFLGHTLNYCITECNEILAMYVVIVQSEFGNIWINKSFTTFLMHPKLLLCLWYYHCLCSPYHVSLSYISVNKIIDQGLCLTGSIMSSSL